MSPPRILPAFLRQARSDNRNTANSMAVHYDLLQMQLKKADELAEQRYSISHDVWLRPGRVESAAFIRTICWMVIQMPVRRSVAHEKNGGFVEAGALNRGLPPERYAKDLTIFRECLRRCEEMSASVESLRQQASHSISPGGPAIHRQPTDE
jgi:hypothetical protein